MSYWEDIPSDYEYRLCDPKTQRKFKCNNISTADEAIYLAHSQLDSLNSKYKGRDEIIIWRKRTNVKDSEYVQYGRVKKYVNNRVSKRCSTIKSKYWVTIFSYYKNPEKKDKAYPIDKWGNCMYDYREFVRHRP